MGTNLTRHPFFYKALYKASPLASPYIAVSTRPHSNTATKLLLFTHQVLCSPVPTAFEECHRELRSR